MSVDLTARSLLYRDSIAGAVARAIENFPSRDLEHLVATLTIAASGRLDDDGRFRVVMNATGAHLRDAKVMRGAEGRGAHG